MPVKKFTLCLLVFMFTQQQQYAQSPDTLSYFVDFNEETVTREAAIYVVHIFKQQLSDTDYIKEMRDVQFKKIVSTGRVTDAAGHVKHGRYDYFLSGGEKWQSGLFVADKKDGLWEEWHQKGEKAAILHYKKGILYGLNMRWHENGHVLDSFLLNDQGNGNTTGFFDDGKLKFDGSYVAGLKSGNWNFYYPAAGRQKSMSANFEADSVKNMTCFTEDGSLQNKDCFFEKEADFKGGMDAWRAYLIKKLSGASFARHMGDRNLYTVILRFKITKDGHVENIEIENPEVSRLDKIAESIIRQSPKWEPAIQYNQPVNAYRRQPISFAVR